MRYILVDKIIQYESGKSAQGIKNVTMSEDFLTHHFPQYPLMPGMLILEAMVQLASWLIAASTNFRKWGVIYGLQKVKFKKFVRPGEQILLDVSIISMNKVTAQIKGKAKVADKIVTLADFQIKLIDLDVIENPLVTEKFFKILSEELSYQNV
ncbi:MAG: 3-hydroxyacyl-ACP dehydratase FabZ family protein [Promethearchaeota archaeon]|jgi:3-hydroxyacyl-[acyl-carrier-protein] dehydratase